MKTHHLAAVAVTLALLQAAAVAQEQLPDVFHVVDRIGQEVEFQDEVKAVSYSNSTNGYYLSFGAPYPAQVISVWVSAELYDQLPGRRELVGRNARIKGLLEKSPSGALVRLSTREQFQLLQTDETVLSKEVLDGKMDRDQLKAAVRQHLSRGDFERLETLAEELRQSRERFSDGTWLSDAYFSAFNQKPGASTERFATAEQRIRDWENARPGSVVTVIVKAALHRDRAHRSRSADEKAARPREVADELATAREILESNPAAKMYPEYFSVMQSIARSQRWPRDEYFRLFAEAVSRERDYYAFYFNAAEYLLLNGSQETSQWEQFAEEQRLERGRGAEGDALYARIAWAMKPYYPNLFRDSAISWETMASGFDYLLKQYPESRYLRNAYANFAWKAGDRQRVRMLLPEIRKDPDMTIWVNLECLGMAERLASSRGDK